MWTSDNSESWKESLGFIRNSGTYDTIRASNGVFYIGLNMSESSGTEYTLLHSGNISSYAAPIHTHPYLPTAGGIMTGNISYAGSQATYEMVKFINNTDNGWGNGIAIGGGGQAIIGGGESSNVMVAQTTTTGEEIMWIGNDGAIEFFCNLQEGWDYRKSMTFSTDGNLYVGGSKVWTASSLTNNNQLSNGSGYITSSGNCSGATYLNARYVSNSDLSSTTGCFAFTSTSIITSGNDYVGLQLEGGGDKFQITAAGNTLHFRQNDNGGANTSWNSWVSFVTSATIGSQSVNYASSAGNADTLDGYHYNNLPYLPISGGTMTGTLTLSKVQDASGTANNSPALLVGGTVSQAHLEFDSNEIIAKADATSGAALYLNYDGGGNVNICGTGGNVGIGNTSPAYKVDISGTTRIDKCLKISGSTNSTMTTATDNPRIVFIENDTTQAVGIVYTDWDAYRPGKGLKIMDLDGNDPTVWFEIAGSVYATGAITAGSASDIRLKENIREYNREEAKNTIMSLRPVRFRWNSLASSLYSQYSGEDLGFIAQDLESILPEAIGTIFEEYKRLDYTKLITPLIAHTQDIEERLERVEKLISVPQSHSAVNSLNSCAINSELSESQDGEEEDENNTPLAYYMATTKHLLAEVERLREEINKLKK